MEMGGRRRFPARKAQIIFLESALLELKDLFLTSGRVRYRDYPVKIRFLCIEMGGQTEVSSS